MAYQLDGVNAGAVGLMVVVTGQLALSAVVDPLTPALAVGSPVALSVWQPSSVLLMGIGAIAGITAVGAAP